MAILDKITTRDREPAEPAHESKEPHNNVANEGHESDSTDQTLFARNEKEVERNPDKVTEDAHLGVQKAEAAAMVWSKKAVYATYAWIWVCFFLLALQSAVSGAVIQNAYSNFAGAPQVATASILYSIIGGVLKLPIAKVLNLWGRAEGFLIFLFVYILGLIIVAACNNPDSYAAGYVLFYVGYNVLFLILDVFMADTSGMRNRAFTFAFSQTPFICTAFTGPLAGQSFLKVANWRWAHGAFAIINTVAFLPLAVVFKFYQKKAEKMGLYQRQPSGRTTKQSIIHYIHEFDLIGAVLLMAGWVLILLPFSLANPSTNRAGYKSATFIAMIIVGFFTLVAFAAWEKWGARQQFIRYELLKQRTVLGACFMSAIAFFSFYCWDLYFNPFCLVVYNLSVADAGYMTQIYNIGSCFWGVVFGIYIRWTKHFKYACLFFGLPLLILGAGLMIHFRGEDQGIGYVVMCQIFIAFGGGTLVIGEDMAVMASADREGVPMMLALIGLFSSLGGAIGQAIGAAIYNNVFVSTLAPRLPSGFEMSAQDISDGGYLVQQTYAPGSDVRNAINYSWGRSQMYGSIAATALLVLGFPAVGVWRNYNVDKKQNKGTLI
ncbi:major facilitator superfamily domain-containing protein [Aspergillus unguis]